MTEKGCFWGLKHDVFAHKTPFFWVYFPCLVSFYWAKSKDLFHSHSWCNNPFFYRLLFSFSPQRMLMSLRSVLFFCHSSLGFPSVCSTFPSLFGPVGTMGMGGQMSFQLFAKCKTQNAKPKWKCNAVGIKGMKMLHGGFFAFCILHFCVLKKALPCFPSPTRVNNHK